MTKKFFGSFWFSLFFSATVIVFGQYVGSPVKKDLLIRELRSKQLQTRDIVHVIKENGVDFKLTPAVENELIAAGARPSVIEAVRNNYRYAQPVQAEPAPANTKTRTGAAPIAAAQKKPPVKSYDDLIHQAVEEFDNQNNRYNSLEALQQAVRLSPNKPRAFQLLGYLFLYGFKNLPEAENNWKTAINNGGSAVIRVIHDHNGTFTSTCEGSLYIARDSVRFESDNNRHTFETADRNIKKVEINSRFRRLVQLKGGSFKIVLFDEEKDDDKKFSFAPLSGDTKESEMIIRLIGKN
jgi:hypothetical protein